MDQDQRIPERFRKLYGKGRAGNTKASTRFICLECVGFQPNEVEQCTSKNCVNYPMRNLKAQAETQQLDRAKRSARAKAAGLKPPKRPSANGHGDHVGGPNSNATDSTRPATPPNAPATPDVGSDSERGDTLAT